MDMNNAFDIIVNRVKRPLLSKGYTRESVADSADEMTALFVGELAYSVVYTSSNNRVVLRSCAVEDGVPDNDWKTLATWLFDPEADGIREAESIGDDFSDTIRGPKQSSAAKKQKKRKKDGEATVDPLFLANRMVTYFPALKDQIAYEKAHYEEFRGVTFIEEKVVPLFAPMINEANEKKIEKISQGLAALYTQGDLDTKGIITYILLNSIDDDEKFSQLIGAFPDNDKKVAKAARNLRGKKIKPEKVKKSRSFIADNLNS